MSSPLSAFPWHEKVALITGGAGGMGVAISVLLRRLGSKIAIVDVSPAALSRMKEQYPDVSIKIIDGVKYQELKVQYKNLLPFWEGK